MTGRAQAMARLVAEQVVEVLVERGLLRQPSPEDRARWEDSADNLLSVMRAKAERNGPRRAARSRDPVEDRALDGRETRVTVGADGTARQQREE